MSEAGDEATERAGAAIIRAADAEIVCVLGRLAARPLAEPVAAQMRQLLVRAASSTASRTPIGPRPPRVQPVRPARSSMSGSTAAERDPADRAPGLRHPTSPCRLVGASREGAA